MELAQWGSAAASFDNNINNGVGGSGGQTGDGSGSEGGKYSPIWFANSGLFEPKGCFQGVQEGAENYDNLYCVGNTLIMILSFFNILLFTTVLALHVKQNLSLMDCTKVLIKVKTTMLILVVILEISVFIRYTFVIESSKVYDAILIISGFIQSQIFFQICYFYSKKAAHFLENSERTRKLMRYVMYVSLILFFGMAIYQFWDQELITDGRSNLCHSFYFIMPSIVN